MNPPDIQRFDHDGVWVKPSGAVRVDVALKGGDGAPLPARNGTLSMTVENIVGANAAELVTRSFTAGELPDTMPVNVGQPGGYAVITSYLE